MSAQLLTAYAITAGYGRLDILHDVSVHVSPGEIVSVIGPNGAGKSTAFKTIVGFLRPRTGRVVFNGEEITGLRPDLVLRRGLAYVPQGRLVFPQMTVLENLEMGAYTVEEPARIAEAFERVYALFPILAERRKQKAGTMSGGEQQMVAIGRALMTRPRMLMLDEPSLGLSPRFMDEVFEKIVALAKDGMTIMLVEQNAARALEISHRGYVLELGRNRFEGAGTALLADPEVKRPYLGG
ncbi:MAG TPA: ABC transporter ATP-binding protein [Gemmatimonadaceae bacterium]